MPEQAESKQICPYLGLIEDRDSHFSYPEAAHFCFVTKQESAISLEHQSSFCFTAKYSTCSRFGGSPSEIQLVQASLPRYDSRTKKSNFSLKWIIFFGLAGLLTGSLLMFGIFYYNNYVFQQGSTSRSANSTTPSPTATALSTPTQNITPTEAIEKNTSTPASLTFLATPTPTATPLPGIQVYTLSPAAADIGWVVNNEERGNHFGDSFLHVGTFEGQVYNSGFQFDLSSIPRGAPIYQASLQLTGLRDDRLAVRNDRGAGGAWMLRFLAPEVDQDWRRHNYQNIFNAPALYTLNPILSDQDLAIGKVNQFELSPSQIRILETRIIEDEDPKISFRLDGPLVGPDNLFVWDTGYGPQSRGEKVVLSLNVGQPPATPPPYEYVVVTSTPTPENVVTAAAISAQMTADATRIGTATLAPANVATATPIPDYLVIIPTWTPENTATTQALAVLATAEAQTTGTPTPFPTNAVTATPIPTDTPIPTGTPTPTLTSTPTLSNFVLITATSTPQTVFEAATRSVAATIQAETVGTPTPLPTHWLMPIVVTDTPTPANVGTVQALVDLAAAIAITTGTPTPIPPNIVTATPTPIFESIAFLLTPTPTPPSVATQPIPSILLGKILFRSDREGADKDFIYIFDPDTGELGRLTDNWPYFVARERNTYSADTVYRTYNKKLLWTNIEVELPSNRTIYRPTTIFAIHYYDYKYKMENQVTRLGTGLAWDPIWSPTSEQIAFVSNDSGDDEIWVVNRDGSNLLQLTSSNEAYNAREIGKDTFISELNGYPSWSPDGSKLVFWSNRTRNRQLWIMNSDGSDQQLLMGWNNWTPYNDWDPVWVKYIDPAPPEDQER